MLLLGARSRPLLLSVSPSTLPGMDPPTPCRFRSIGDAERPVQSTARIINLAPLRTGNDPAVQPRDPHLRAHVLLLWADGLVATVSATVIAWSRHAVQLDIYARTEHWKPWIEARYVQRCDCPV